nr:MAG TPA: hypothetical protein [Caudoviricetes sp.]
MLELFAIMTYRPLVLRLDWVVTHFNGIRKIDGFR